MSRCVLLAFAAVFALCAPAAAQTGGVEGPQPVLPVSSEFSVGTPERPYLVTTTHVPHVPPSWAVEARQVLIDGRRQTALAITRPGCAGVAHVSFSLSLAPSRLLGASRPVSGGMAGRLDDGGFWRAVSGRAVASWPLGPVPEGAFGERLWVVASLAPSGDFSQRRCRSKTRTLASVTLGLELSGWQWRYAN